MLGSKPRFDCWEPSTGDAKGGASFSTTFRTPFGDSYRSFEISSNDSDDPRACRKPTSDVPLFGAIRSLCGLVDSSFPRNLSAHSCGVGCVRLRKSRYGIAFVRSAEFFCVGSFDCARRRNSRFPITAHGVDTKNLAETQGHWSRGIWRFVWINAWLLRGIHAWGSTPRFDSCHRVLGTGLSRWNALLVRKRASCGSQSRILGTSALCRMNTQKHLRIRLRPSRTSAFSIGTPWGSLVDPRR